MPILPPLFKVMEQTESYVLATPVAELSEPCQRNDVIYYSQTVHETVEIIPPEEISSETKPRGSWDASEKPQKPFVKDSTQPSLLSRQWEIFRHDLQKASSEDQHNFFESCARFAPELAERTDKEWRNHFRMPSEEAEQARIDENRRSLVGELPQTKTYNSSPLLLHLLLAALAETSAIPQPSSFFQLLKKSANDNLADLRKLLGATKEEQISCNELTLDDRIIRALPVGFAKEVYEVLPAALINGLPFKTVTDTLSIIDQAAPHMRKPENKFRLLIYQCAVSQEDGNAFRIWMASQEGELRYLQTRHSLKELMTESELALSLTVLRCYELVLDDDEDSQPVKEAWVDSFMAYMNGDTSSYRSNLWNVVGASFRSACHRIYHPTDTSCLDTVLDTVFDETTSSSDELVQTYWICRLTENAIALQREASHNEPQSQPMQRQISRRGYC